MQARAAAMIRAGVEPENVAATMKAEQDEIAAIERRAADITAFIAAGRQRSDVLDQVAQLAGHMAGNLAQLDIEGQRPVVATLDLSAVFENPADPGSPVTITSRYGAASLTPDVHASSTEV